MLRRQNWLSHFISFLGVILGVYLAFYLSERASERHERAENAIFMKAIISDLENDMYIYENYQIPVNRKQQDDLNLIIEMLVKDSLNALGEMITNVFQVENSSPTTLSYTSMKASGKLHLINDINLQKQLNNFYESLAQECISKGQFQADYFTDELLSWINYNFDLIDMSIVKKDELVVLRNKLIMYQSFIDSKIECYQMILDSSKALISSIESKLDSR